MAAQYTDAARIAVTPAGSLTQGNVQAGLAALAARSDSVEGRPQAFIQETAPVEGLVPWVWLPVDAAGVWDGTFHVYAIAGQLLTELNESLTTEAGDLLALGA